MELLIAVRRADDGTWRAGLADHDGLVAEGYPTPGGALASLQAQVENEEGWNGLWAQAKAVEEAMWNSMPAFHGDALADSVRRLEEVCVAGPSLEEAWPEACGDGPLSPRAVN